MGHPVRGSSSPIFGNGQRAARLVAGVVGRGVGVGGEPFVKGDGEGEEFGLAVEGVDLFDIELGVDEGGVVELLNVVEEEAGEGGVGLDCGGGEAELVVVLGDLFVDGVVDGDGDEGNLGALGGLDGEEAAVDIVFGGGGDLVVVGGDELDAGVVEGEGAVAVVGDDDADREEAVLDVGEAEEGALLEVVAGFGCDGDLLIGVGVEGGVLRGGLGGRGGLVCGAGQRSKAEQRGCEEDWAVAGAAWRAGAMRAHAGLIMIFAGAVVKRGSAERDGRVVVGGGDGVV